VTGRELLLLGRRAARLTMADRRRDGRAAERLPFTVEHVQCQCRRLGRPVGEHRARAIRRALLDAGELEPSGQYAQRDPVHGKLTGYKVALYHVAGRLVPRRKRRGGASGLKSFSVRSGRVNSPRSCWAHPLFGDLDHGRTLRERLRTWREPPDWQARRDERTSEGEVEAVARALDATLADRLAVALDLDLDTRHDPEEVHP